MTTLTPSQIAEQLRVHKSKVLGWIHRGELAAINVASRPDGRPRYRIHPDALAAFQSRRSEAVAAPLKPRRQQRDDVISFFENGRRTNDPLSGE